MNIPQKKTVYFVRHGESEHNIAPVFQGADSRLSQQGIAQAGAVADRLKNVTFEALISSPYPRAKQTAQAIADKTGHGIVTSDLFVERKKPSSIEGEPYADKTARKVYNDYVASLFASGKQIEDAENYDSLVARADKALDYLLARPESTLAVVTHGWFLRVIVARIVLGSQLNGETLKRFEELVSINNTSVTVLNYRDAFEEDFRWRVWTINDHSHFAE